MRSAAAILFLSLVVTFVATVAGDTCCCTDRGARSSSCCVAPTDSDLVEIGCASACRPGTERTAESATRSTRTNAPDREIVAADPVRAVPSFVVANTPTFDRTAKHPPGPPAGRDLLTRILVLRI